MQISGKPGTSQNYSTWLFTNVRRVRHETGGLASCPPDVGAVSFSLMVWHRRGARSTYCGRSLPTYEHVRRQFHSRGLSTTGTAMLVSSNGYPEQSESPPRYPRKGLCTAIPHTTFLVPNGLDLFSSSGWAATVPDVWRSVRDPEE